MPDAPAPETIAMTAEATGGDPVVLGTHGRSGLVPATIGSTAESLRSWAAPDTLMLRQPG